MKTKEQELTYCAHKYCIKTRKIFEKMIRQQAKAEFLKELEHMDTYNLSGLEGDSVKSFVLKELKQRLEDDKK